MITHLLASLVALTEQSDHQTLAVILVGVAFLGAGLCYLLVHLWQRGRQAIRCRRVRAELERERRVELAATIYGVPRPRKVWEGEGGPRDAA